MTGSKVVITTQGKDLQDTCLSPAVYKKQTEHYKTLAISGKELRLKQKASLCHQQCTPILNIARSSGHPT